MPEIKRYLGRASDLYDSQSNIQNVNSEQALKHPPKAVHRQGNKQEEEGEHMFSMSCSTDSLISPAWSFSSLSHSNSPRAASGCNHLITSAVVL